MTRMIPEQESMTVEFKSDAKRLGDADLAAAVVCLANTQGGEIYLGVENDGKISGLHAAHRDLGGLAAMVANRTTPPVSVRVVALEEGGVTVARIEVPKSQRLVATTDGVIRRRRLQADGKPECVPFLPHEFAGRQSDLGLLDYSALPVADATEADLDPIERQRVRRAIERFGGDRALLGLADPELEGALGLVRTEQGRRVPTVTGLLLLGTASALRTHLPTHEVAFQVLDGTDVRVNEFYRGPLLQVFERIEEQFSSRITEQEIQVDLFRVPIPTFDRRALREAFVNAVCHRDYTRLGAVHVRWENDGLSIGNPGGFVEGVTLDNLLVTDPRPRNPSLADTLKRLGLAERTGRGIDMIFNGLLRYGRPAPDYSRSTPTSVVVRLSSAEADLPFLRMILDCEGKRKAPLSLDALIALSGLREGRRLGIEELAKAIQKDDAHARSAVEGLVEAGLVTAHGVKKGRTYTLSAAVYHRLGKDAEYVRQAGFDPIQHEGMVKQYVQSHGKFRRRDVIGLCRIGEYQATRLLSRLVEAGFLVRQGKGKAAFYERGGKLRARS